MPLIRRLELIRPDVFQPDRDPVCRHKLDRNDAFVREWRPTLPIIPKVNFKNELYHRRKPFYPDFMYDKPDMNKIMSEEYRRMWQVESWRFLAGLNIREAMRLPRRPFIKYGSFRKCCPKKCYPIRYHRPNKECLEACAYKSCLCSSIYHRKCLCEGFPCPIIKPRCVPCCVYCKKCPPPKIKSCKYLCRNRCRKYCNLNPCCCNSCGCCNRYDVCRRIDQPVLPIAPGTSFNDQLRINFWNDTCDVNEVCKRPCLNTCCR